MLVKTSRGLYCRAGNFYIDPSGAVERAVITHAHSDHARRGSQTYFCAQSGAGLLRARLGKNIKVESHPFRKAFRLGPVEISFHPAGHILGSSQVRLSYGGEVWVASGDYKRDPDPTCEPFEPVPCDVFVTEATFGTPSFTWPKGADVGAEILQWWEENAKKKTNSVLFAYSLGKAQRILGVLHGRTEKPIYCYPTVTPLSECYLKEGVKLAPAICLSTVKSLRPLSGALFLVPQSFLNSEGAALLGDRFETAFASGWTAQSSHGYDKGFVMSDHADWNDLLKTIQETKAKRIYVQHRGKGALVRHLKLLGLHAFPDSELVPEDPRQLELF